AGTAYVVEARLKVMLEEDYLSLEKYNSDSPPLDPPLAGLVGGARGGGDSQNPPSLTLPAGRQASNTKGEGINNLGSNIIREIIIPELTKEINEGKNFAQLRQVYNSLILATWYKKKIKDSILAQVYADKNKVAGVGFEDVGAGSKPAQEQRAGLEPAPTVLDVKTIYQRYLKAFKKGVYNYIKEDVDPATQERIPRKYFSGGWVAGKVEMDKAMKITTDEAMLSGVYKTLASLVLIGASVISSKVIAQEEKPPQPSPAVTAPVERDKEKLGEVSFAPQLEEKINRPAVTLKDIEQAEEKVISDLIKKIEETAHLKHSVNLDYSIGKLLDLSASKKVWPALIRVILKTDKDVSLTRFSLPPRGANIIFKNKNDLITMNEIMETFNPAYKIMTAMNKAGFVFTYEKFGKISNSLSKEDRSDFYNFYVRYLSAKYEHRKDISAEDLKILTTVLLSKSAGVREKEKIYEFFQSQDSFYYKVYALSNQHPYAASFWAIVVLALLPLIAVPFVGNIIHRWSQARKVKDVSLNLVFDHIHEDTLRFLDPEGHRVQMMEIAVLSIAATGGLIASFFLGMPIAIFTSAALILVLVVGSS
ncbi:MAG: hypothetical protein HQL15_10200, partial [Candidatus Omnitrophica bacterium]|nr:hypothetical protein [Candidatus Omnitrophota bacterium]